MKIVNDSKIQNGGPPARNGSLHQDETDLELQKAFEGHNGSCSGDSHGSVSPVDTIPFNIEGIQTVVKNSTETSTKNGFENGLTPPNLILAELQRCKDENLQLRAALKEASRVNQQWRNYHDQRQGYVQKLLNSLQDLQQSTSLTQANGRTSLEFQRLRDTFSRQQKEHNEHIQLLQLQVRAHRDDWEAERSEKKAAQMCRMEAEAKVQILKRQLEEANNMLSDAEGRLKLCKCFAASNGDVNSLDRRAHSFNLQNGSTLPTELSSPSFSSSNSICSGTSRSSSVSKDLSTSSSPTILKNMQSLSPYSLSGEVSRTTSPSMRTATKSSTIRNTENQQWQERNGVENQSCSAFTSQSRVDDLPVSSSHKLHQIPQDLSQCNNKQRGNSKLKEEHFVDNSAQYYESKGARPKSAGKVNDEDERQAKHRARSILASALPMSPSSSKPSSPITVSFGKANNMPKDCIPITSTVLTPVNFKPPYGSNKTIENIQQHEGNVKRNIQPDIFHSDSVKELNKVNQIVNGNSDSLRISKSHELDIENNGKNKLSSNELTQSKENVSAKGKIFKKSEDSAVVCKSNDLQECLQCSSIQINGLTRQNSSSSENISIVSTKNSSNGVTISKSSKDEVGGSKDSFDVKTASKMIQNTKSLIVTNNQHEKFNTNYASITVMPGPSSALYSHTQSASTTSSRSSSPGISLTTFALNANGQGVPGAIYFALGSEQKLSKSPQPCLTVPSSGIGSEFHEESNTAKNNPTTCKELPESGTNERVVNSTWVQLMGKENQASRPPSRTPWRTARAVPSHKLNSVRKTHPEDTCNGLVAVVTDVVKQNETFFPTYNCIVGNTIMCNGNNHSITQQNYETRYQTSFTPPPTYISCSRTSPNILITPTPPYSDSDFRNGSSPTICVIPHANGSHTHAESDLRTMASRNISSAILSYECGNKGCTNSSNGGIKQTINSPNACYDEHSIKHETIGTSSEHCLICPSCQKLFTQENSPKYSQHLQICGGPKYADM